MALYLVVHAPKETEDEAVRPPSRLAELARSALADGDAPRWVKTWSPDLHDDRIFSMWEATDAAAILAAMERYGFLDHLTAHPLRVTEWGPADVLAAEAASEAAGSDA